MTPWDSRDAWNLKDLTGRVFGTLTVTARAENYKSGATRWIARCSSCGTVKTYIGNNLTQGKTRSCSCALREQPWQQRLHCVTHDITCNSGGMGYHRKKHGGTCVIVRLECTAPSKVMVDPIPVLGDPRQ
jgi:hypothetical protein